MSLSSSLLVKRELSGESISEGNFLPIYRVIDYGIEREREREIIKFWICVDQVLID